MRLFAPLTLLVLYGGCYDPFIPPRFDFVLEWTCESASCEREDEIRLIDRADITGQSLYLESTTDELYHVHGVIVPSDPLPDDCAHVYSLTMFGHELDPALYCDVPGGLDLRLTIPPSLPDGDTPSDWYVHGTAQ